MVTAIPWEYSLPFSLVLKRSFASKNVSVHITPSNLFAPARVDEIVIQNISVHYLLFLKFWPGTHDNGDLIASSRGVSRHPNNSEGFSSVPPQCSAILRINSPCIWPNPTVDSIANLHNVGEKYHLGTPWGWRGVCDRLIKIIVARHIRVSSAWTYHLYYSILMPKVSNASRASFSSVRTLITYTRVGWRWTRSKLSSSNSRIR